MKKKIIMLVAAAMMTLSASSAFAAFGDAELFRIVYDRAGIETGQALGNVAALTAPGAPKTIAGSFNGVPAAAAFVTYFALDRTTNQLWISGTTGQTLKINGGATGLTSAKSGFAGFVGLFTTYDATTGLPNGNASSYTGLAADLTSYKLKLSATQGNFGSAILAADRLKTEASLASVIGTTGGSVTQSLYFYNSGLTTVAAQKIGVEVATITTSFDGSSTITTPTAATPIPPAFFLMGSGLLGMFGLRRKNKVA
ncbi:MAG: hypothetical protein ACOYL3_09755 [Desulfuromonadaceae bacterium]